MKIKSIILFSFVSALLSGCSSYSYRLSDTLVSEGNYGGQNIDDRYIHFATYHRSYDFLQDVGGILVFEPAPQADETYFLPILVDVSGKTNITVQPTVNHPDLGIKEIIVGRHKLDKSRILIYVRTASLGEKAPSSISRGLNIGTLEPGKYTVEYLNRGGSTVVLREFTIAK